MKCRKCDMEINNIKCDNCKFNNKYIIKCPNCKNKIKISEKECPNCNNVINDNEISKIAKKNIIKQLLIYYFIVIFCIVLLRLLFYTGIEKAKSMETALNEVIDLLTFLLNYSHIFSIYIGLIVILFFVFLYKLIRCSKVIIMLSKKNNNGNAVIEKIKIFFIFLLYIISSIFIPYYSLYYILLSIE